MSRIIKATLLLQFILLSVSIFAQNGSDEPCNAPEITVNPIGSSCASIVTATINNGVGTEFTNSTSASSGVILPTVDCNLFGATTRDWWYKIVVPGSGYFSVDLTVNSNSTYFDWVMYTSSSATCSGATFREITNSSQCTIDGGIPVFTGVGPLTPGTVVYLRMWREADYTQDATRDYELCVNATSAAPIGCPTPISPVNNSLITFPATLTWTSVADATGYALYVRDVTNGGGFVNLGSVAGNSVILGGELSYSTIYEWFVIPLNAEDVGNNSCRNTLQFKTPGAPPASTCATATQICAPFSFSAGVDQPEDGAGTDADYDCLLSAPNPEYHWIKITSNGNIRWNIKSVPDQDVDFAIWGPFTGLTPSTPTCGTGGAGSNGFPCGAALGTPLRCNYAETNGGNVSINSAVAGQYYLVLVTNYENLPATINITNNTGNTAGIECPCLVNELVVAPKGDCNNNIYSVDYSVSFTNAPVSGTLTITDGEGHSTVLTAPFTSPLTGTITGLTADGVFHTFTASFSANPGCKLCTSYTAPEPAPTNNSCSTGLPLTANASAGAATGYTNECTGKSIGEATYCGTPACRSIFYKIHTSAVAVDRTLSIDFDGGNSGDGLSSCPNGIRVSVLTDCNTAAAVTPSNCQTVVTSTDNLTFGDLLLNTDYYIAVDQVNCTDESCNWSMRFLGIGVLPVTMGSFEVLKMTGYNALRWITVNEQKTDHFEMLRSSDGITYQNIGKLTASHNRNGYIYTFADNAMPDGINYYKIKTVNKDGTYELSEIRKINNSSATFSLSVRPNPAKNNITVSVTNAENGNGKFIITDGVGRKLAITEKLLKAGKNQFDFDISTYNAGVLYIKFIDKNGVTVTQPINKLR
ncbi:T9SS type A sorting domain-containing protein [Ferruginibacter lapsinanis]|uniref:T9SS type A sorting domain-containing protein n=1 Tax=Ferruginibacter lapsinanis TaxID=563172 RepID=UPI001E588E13|nr:T9SS type A sorting domain-containing protein [Ferruginibacter lapsinanis]UEG49589.1 T9SS type A sorting domain-containing protein [Ferruginibacter lapsinanis]